MSDVFENDEDEKAKDSGPDVVGSIALEDEDVLFEVNDDPAEDIDELFNSQSRNLSLVDAVARSVIAG